MKKATVIFTLALSLTALPHYAQSNPMDDFFDSVASNGGEDASSTIHALSTAASDYVRGGRKDVEIDEVRLDTKIDIKSITANNGYNSIGNLRVINTYLKSLDVKSNITVDGGVTAKNEGGNDIGNTNIASLKGISYQDRLEIKIKGKVEASKGKNSLGNRTIGK